MKRKFDESGENGLVVDGVESHASVFVFDGYGVRDVSVGKAQRGDEAQVEISAQTFAADDAYGEAWHDVALYVIDTDGLRGLAADGAHGPGRGGVFLVLVVVNSLDGVHHLVESQQKTEMIGFLLVFWQVVHHFSLSDGWGHEASRDKQCDGDYFDGFFHVR